MTQWGWDASSLRKQGLWLLTHAEFTWHKNQVRPLLWAAQEGRCYCGCDRVLVSHFRYKTSGDRDTIDHVHPLGMHGPDQLGNLALATHNCNERKGSRPPTLQQMEELRRINDRLGWPTPIVW